jgi:hypothetical protein
MFIFTDEPDQALVVAVDGYCFAAFRGTVVTSWIDMYQNMIFGNEQVCNANSATYGLVECCDVERGFYEGYNTNYRTGMEAALRDCASTCTPPTDESGNTDWDCPTVVLTGHSQGGSIAATAALYLTDLSPIVITFGQPPTINSPCNLVDSENYYRFVNSRVGSYGTTYDPVPYLPYDANQFGHQIMLGEDDTSVAYIGKDTEVVFLPYDTANNFASHRLEPPDNGYIQRIDSLFFANAGSSSFYLPTGFRDGSVCSQDVECDSLNCDNERCVS